MIAMNVAQLLRAPVGTSRSFEFEDDASEFADELHLRGPVTGSVKLTRTSHGILAETHYTVDVEQECGRCLEPAVTTIESSVEQEFLPSTNILTGLPETIDADPDEPRVSPNHELDLTDTIRQDIVVQQPLQPLCRPDCPGLCPSCGRELQQGGCSCPPAEGGSDTGQLGRLGELLKVKLPPTS